MKKTLLLKKLINKLRPESPYKLKEIINSKNFDPNKYLKHQRLQERKMGGQTFYNSIVVNDIDQLRKSLLQNKEYITSPKKFLSKQEFSELKQNSRLMHQFYSTDVNAPVELKQSTRFLKKSGSNMKALK